MARCRESGTAAAGWLWSCACQELTLPGLPGPAYLAWPCNNAGRAGRGCDYVAHRVPINGQAWHYLICSGYYLSGIGAGSCPVQRCCLIIVGLLLAGTGHQAAASTWGLPLWWLLSWGLLPWWLPCEDCRYGDCRPGAGLLFCFHHLHLQEDAISLQLCLSG